MAESSLSNSNLDLSSLSDKDRTDIRQILASEDQKSRVQTVVHSLTDVCFRKCITGTIRSAKLDKTEESCLANCAERFVDVTRLTIGHLQKVR
ncbi:Tim10/DDP family zinc finger-domain-containing protein [Hypoxylon sp. FL1284]|nr:Tim10/DDP family zinc finger-domain-containing protein [Hypoxylon sp. FL1284]